MLTEAERKTISSSFALVVPIAATAADLFYKRLFEIQPGYRKLFKGDMDRQKGKLVAMLVFIVKSLDYPDSAWRDIVDEDNDLFLILLALGRRHKELYHVPDKSYDDVGAALLWALDYGLGKAFTPEVRDAWAKVYGLLALVMKLGVNSVVDIQKGKVA